MDATLPATEFDGNSPASAGAWPFVTVVMPVRNEAGAIRESLGAVLEQDYPVERYEVIVADGMSADATREIVTQMSAGRSVRTIDNPGRIAPTGLNAAICQARGEVIVRVDGHCIVPHDYLSNCVRLLREHQCAGVGGPINTVGSSDWAEAIATAMSSKFGVGGSAFRTINDREMWAETVPFPAYERKVFEQVGLYDEELVRNQDDEFNARIRKAGGKLLLSPALQSTYFSRSSLRSLARQYFQYGLWKVRVLQKHPRQMNVRHFLPALFIVLLLVLAIGTPFHVLFGAGLGLALAAYATGALLASAILARRTSWRQFFRFPPTFAALHFGYGLGFMAGLWRFRSRWRDDLGSAPAYVAASPR